MINETPKQAARRLAAYQIQQGFEPEAFHEYQDHEGKALYWRLRLKQPETGEKWIRPMSQDEQGQFILKEPEFPSGKPLYHLPEIIRSPESAIWIVEGEHCADQLAKLGVVVTTSGSADSASKAAWGSLANRSAIIWRDNDDTGLRYAKEVTEQLQILDCEIQWVDITQLNLPQKGDCVDWLKLHPQATLEDLHHLPLLTPPVPSAEKVMQALPSNFRPKPHGLFYYDPEFDSEKFIASRLEITALVRNQASENWGRLLEFDDADSNRHVWAMPMEMLKGNGEELRGELLRLGLEIAPGSKARSLLLEYIISSKPRERVRCVNRIGWHDQVFVLPNRTIGLSQERMVYQSESLTKSLTQSGTLAEWKNSVSRLCAGNSRLILAISAGFASMLLYLAGEESGGIHFVGESSSGKTTALRVAASVYGSASDYLHRWRATINGLEALAVSRCDSLLILDELAQVDPKEAGEIAYMLANGSGKARANRNGQARSRHEWRLLFLSAGEIGLAQHMNEAGKKIKAGQAVRLVEVSADANQGHGIFENLHEYDSGATLSKIITEACQHFYGTPALAFLEAITNSQNFEKLPTIIHELRQQFVATYLPPEASGQASRVCDRFALIAAAGEIATTFGITGWAEGDTMQAVGMCFESWLEQRGGGNNQEEKTILFQVKSFFEQHGNGRFSEWDHPDSVIQNRAGFKKKQKDGRTWFYVLPEVFKNQICLGLAHRIATKTLLKFGWLEIDSDGKSSKRETLPGIGRSRCYVFNHQMWEYE